MNDLIFNMIKILRLNRYDFDEGNHRNIKHSFIRTVLLNEKLSYNHVSKDIPCLHINKTHISMVTDYGGKFVYYRK